MSTLSIFLAQALPEGRVFGLDSQTLIQIGIHLFNGILLAVALTFILYKPVKNFMQKRSERIQGEIDKAEETMTKATALIAEYEAKIEEINQERTELLETARKQADEDKGVILHAATQEANEIRKRSQERAAEEKDRLQEEIRLRAIDLAFMIAEKYIGKTMDDESQERYVNQIIAQLEDL